MDSIAPQLLVGLVLLFVLVVIASAVLAWMVKTLLRDRVRRQRFVAAAWVLPPAGGLYIVAVQALLFLIIPSQAGPWVTLSMTGDPDRQYLLLLAVQFIPPICAFAVFFFRLAAYQRTKDVAEELSTIS